MPQQRSSGLRAVCLIIENFLKNKLFHFAFLKTILQFRAIENCRLTQNFLKFKNTPFKTKIIENKIEKENQLKTASPIKRFISRILCITIV